MITSTPLDTESQGSTSANTTIFKPNFVIICDDAVVSEGKLSVSGVFDSVYSEGFPALHPSLTIVTHKEVLPGDHTEIVKVRMGDKIVLEFERPFSNTKPRHQYIHRVKDFNLPTEGRYDVEFYVDSEKLAANYFVAQFQKRS